MKEEKYFRHPELPRDEFINKFWDFLVDSFYYPILFKIRDVFINFEDPIYRGVLLRGFYGDPKWFFKVKNFWSEFLVRRGNLYDLLFQFHIAGWKTWVFYFCVDLKRKNYFWFKLWDPILLKEYDLEEDVIRTPYYYFRLRASYPGKTLSHWIVFNERDFVSVTRFFTWTFRSFTPLEILYDFTLDIGEECPSFGGWEGREIRKIYFKSKSSILGFKTSF